jgi:hypothetical protein
MYFYALGKTLIMVFMSGFSFNPSSNYGSVLKNGLVLIEAGPERLNLYTQSNILEQIETLKLDTLNTALPLKQRIDAKNQFSRGHLS